MVVLALVSGVTHDPDERAGTLMDAFESLLRQHEYFGAIFAAI